VLAVAVTFGSVFVWGSLREMYYGVPEMGRHAASATPKEMTLKEFLNAPEGPEDYVKLTDFTWCRRYGSRRAPRSSSYDYSIPVVPPGDDADPRPSAVRLIVVARGKADDVATVRKLTEVQGLVHGFREADARDREVILDAYPGLDTKRCRVLLHLSRRAPATAEQIEARRTEARTFLLISGVFTATCLLLYFRLGRRTR
jgi:hypothetical protein